MNRILYPYAVIGYPSEQDGWGFPAMSRKNVMFFPRQFGKDGLIFA